MRLVELCCGSAALSLAALGAKRPILPYQGSKWRFRMELLRLIGPVDALELWDVGPWGTVAPAVLSPSVRAAVIEALERLAVDDARAVYERLQGAPVPDTVADYAAQYLFLQRLAFSGKAVGDRDGRWSSPGFNASSAFGLAGTDRFGPVRPMVPSLIGVLRGYDALLQREVTGGRGRARPPSGPALDAVVYIDPPYRGSTAYPGGGLDRDELVALALAWAAAGARVLISEGEPVDALCERGWTTARLDRGRVDTSPFRGKQAEWLTVSPKARKKVIQDVTSALGDGQGGGALDGAAAAGEGSDESAVLRSVTLGQILDGGAR